MFVTTSPFYPSLHLRAVVEAYPENQLNQEQDLILNIKHSSLLRYITVVKGFIEQSLPARMK